MNNDLKLICMQLITAVGTARSNYILAIRKAKENSFLEAEKLIISGNEYFSEGHNIHSKFLQKMAIGEQIDINLLLLHAEDQLMAAEIFRTLAEEFIDLYKKINKNRDL